MLNSIFFTFYFAHYNKIDDKLFCSFSYLSFSVSVFYCLCFPFFSEMISIFRLSRSFSVHICPSFSWSFWLHLYFSFWFFLVSSLCIYLILSQLNNVEIILFISIFLTDGIIQPWRDSPVWDSQVIKILILVFWCCSFKNQIIYAQIFAF